MIPDHLKYCESLATDLDTGNQPFSASCVRKILTERADLLAACEAALPEIRALFTQLPRGLQKGVNTADELPAGCSVAQAVAKLREAIARAKQ